MHGLRRVLGAERIERRGAGYSVRVEPGELDLERFEGWSSGAGGVHGGRPADAADDLREALGLWRGAPLADLARPSPRRRPRLDERRVEGGRAAERRASSRSAARRARAASSRRSSPSIRIASGCASSRSSRSTAPGARRTRSTRTARRARARRRARRRARACAAGARAGHAEAGSSARRADAARTCATPLPAPPTPLVGRRIEIAAVDGAAPARRRARSSRSPGRAAPARRGLRSPSPRSRRRSCATVRRSSTSRRVADPALLLPTIAQALEVAEGERARRVASLRDRSLLLVLDNLEQLLDGVPPIGALLAGAPRLRVLATSRAPLRLYGEHEYPVPPLSPPADAGDFEELAANDAVRLFAARARAATRLRARRTRSRSVAAICRRLDGLPLAIELAAARSKLLPLATSSRRLGRVARRRERRRARPAAAAARPFARRWTGASTRSRRPSRTSFAGSASSPAGSPRGGGCRRGR